MTYDIVFKKFFIDKPNMLKLVLKHFLNLDKIQEISIINPEIPELEDNKLKKNKKDPLIFKTQAKKKLKKSQTHKEELTFLESSLPAENIKGKRVFLDLRVKLSTGEDINVEMQSYYTENFLSRILYYWAKLHSQSLKKGEDYNKVTPTYSLIFTEKPFLEKRIKDFMSSFSIRRDKEPYILFNEDLKIVIVELSKFQKLRSNQLDFKELWCYFIKEAGKLNKEDRKYLSRFKEMEEAMEHFDKLKDDERIKRNRELDEHMSEVIYHLHKQGVEEKIQKSLEKGVQQGMQQGMQQGLKQARKELVFNMLKEGIALSVISKITGLTENAITEIKKSF